MKTFAILTSLVLSLFSGAQVQNSDSTLTHIVVETSTISKNGKVIESKKMYVFDINQSYVLEPTKDDVWLSEAIDHKSCKMIKDVQKNDNTIFIKATKFNRKKTEITYTIPVTKNGLFTINESKNLIGSIDFDLKLIYEPAYKEPIRDTFNTYSEIPLAVVIVPFKDLSKKNREYKRHYIFQISHDFIYCIDRNQNIRYTMQMTRKQIFEDHIEVYAKKFKDNAQEQFFSIPLNYDTDFIMQDSKKQLHCPNFDIEIMREKDFYDK